MLVIANSKSRFDGSQELKRFECLVGYSEFFWIKIIKEFLRTVQTLLPLTCRIGPCGKQFEMMVLLYRVIRLAFSVRRVDERVQP